MHMRYQLKPWQGERRRPFGLNPRTGSALHQRRDVRSDPGAALLNQREQTVCFTGHRRLDDAAWTAQRLTLLLEKLYQLGYRDFISGAALGFDQLAARCVVRLRGQHPEVRLIMAVRCPDRGHLWNQAQAEAYERLLYLADKTLVISDHYFEGCMQKRNRFMVDHASLCVAWMQHPRHSGTYATLCYALKKDVPILNLAMPTSVDELVTPLAAVS